MMLNKTWKEKGEMVRSNFPFVSLQHGETVCDSLINSVLFHYNAVPCSILMSVLHFFNGDLAMNIFLRQFLLLAD